MSGKYVKKKKSGCLKTVLILSIGILILLCILGFLVSRDAEEIPLPTESSPTEIQEQTSSTLAEEIEESVETAETVFQVKEEQEGVTSFSLNGLDITQYGKYMGAYMEDGTDDFVNNVMMIMVTNNTEEAVQYAKITLTGPAGDAVFVLTTLLPGDSAVVLEAERKPYGAEDVYIDARVDNLALFSEMPSLFENVLLIQPMDGGFNITNISNTDITGDIAVYFKDTAGDLLYGGITYMGRIHGGLKSNEIKQIISPNFHEVSTRVVFININQ